MKKILFSVLFLGTILLGGCKKNTKTKTFEEIENDSIKIFYNEIFEISKIDYLYRDQVNWDVVINETKQALTKYSSFEESLKELPNFFERIKCNHCSLFYKDEEYYSDVAFPSDSLLSKQLISKFKSRPTFEAKVLANKYGYILMPGMIFSSFDKETLSKVAGKMYKKIYELKSKNKIKGWILDLRVNQGGTVYPMLLSLYDFLGDGVVFQYLDQNMESMAVSRLENGKYYDQPGIIASIDPKGKLLTKEKVAILIGPGTASSGEITAIAFKGRANTIFIGENTTGLTTVNSEVVTAYNASLALTIGHDADRNKKLYKIVEPDIIVKKQDNFNDLLKDKKVMKAIEYFTQK